jgi:transcriptional regulator with XRE-family HTH domain
MSYRPSAKPPVGRWAAFLHAQRRQRDWSQQRAFKELREGLGLSENSRASYVNIDMGVREPTEKEAAFLVQFFGREPDEAAASGGEVAEGSDLAAAINRQAAAIEAQTKAINLLVAALARQEWPGAVAEAFVRATGLDQELGEPRDLPQPRLPSPAGRVPVGSR